MKKILCAAVILALLPAASAFALEPESLATGLGLTSLARYLGGRLTIHEAVARLGDSIGVRAAVVPSRFGLAAVDVDKPEDLELVRWIVEDQRASQP